MAMQPTATATELLERDDELQELDRLVEEAEGGQGRCVLIEGPPGIGKTRLLEAGRSRATQREMAVLSARPSELDREFPFGVVRQLFEARARAERGTLLDGAAAVAAPLVGLGPAEAAPPAGDP